MGMFDTIIGIAECPYCNNRQEVQIQTKCLNCVMDNYHIGSKLFKGPFLNGNYYLGNNNCISCKNLYLITFSINEQIITSLDTHRSSNQMELTLYYKTLNKFELKNKIKQNCLTVILFEQPLSEVYDFDDHKSIFPYRCIMRLLAYIELYIGKYSDYPECDFVESLFLNLEDEVTYNYIYSVDLNTNLYRVISSDTIIHKFDPYNDTITAIKSEIIANKDTLKDIIKDYYEFYRS